MKKTAFAIAAAFLCLMATSCVKNNGQEETATENEIQVTDTLEQVVGDSANMSEATTDSMIAETAAED